MTGPRVDPGEGGPRISVAVATFDGMPFVREQLASIIGQLGPDDELIVSDNGSTDGTREHLAGLADPRLRLLDYTARRGAVPNFEHALRHVSREVVVLADQDDVWLPGRLARVRSAFASAGEELLCVVADGERIDGRGERIARSNLELLRFAPGLVRNVLRNSFMGCTMAFRCALLEVALPFPPSIPMHDSWLGILAGHFGRVAVIPEPSYRYRLHGRNASQVRRPLSAKLGGRAALLVALAARIPSAPGRRLRAALRAARGRGRSP